MLKLTNLSFAYGGKSVIDNLTYTFPKKGIVVLTGPSGVGKSTLLHLLAGVLTPTDGEITCTFKKTAVAFQEPRLLNWISVTENVNFVLSEKEICSNITKDVLAEFGLSAHKNDLPSALSGGEKQRLSLARAVAVGADLLLLDEPFTALDEALAMQAAASIKAANPNGLTLVITHELKHAEWLDAEVLFVDGTPITALKDS